MGAKELIKDLMNDAEQLARLYQHPGYRQNLLMRIECAANALVGIAKEVDTGPWEVSSDGRHLSSDDFEHDVVLEIKGDFYSDEQRKAYADQLAVRLNGLPKDPPEQLLRSMAMRFRHDFGIDADDNSPMSCGFTEREREALLRTMAQLYEEVSGQGFYHA